MVFRPENGIMETGDYMLRFKFDLPQDIPSSLYFKSKNEAEEPKAKVKYYIKVTFNDHPTAEVYLEPFTINLRVC